VPGDFLGRMCSVGGYFILARSLAATTYTK
jgi:hypothetical protein